MQVKIVPVKIMQAKFWGFVLLALASASSSALTVAPETPTEVQISNKDVNRLVCPAPISGIVASEERGMISNIDGKNAYIKFLVRQEGDLASYAKEETTIFVSADGETYTLRLKPSDIPAQTIFLANPLNKQKANNTLYGGMPLEERITDLTLRAIKDDIPESFTVATTPLSKRRWLSGVAPGVRVAKVRDITPEGSGIRLSEFVVQAIERVQLHEKLFINQLLAKDVIGITLGKLHVPRGTKTQLYLVSLHKEG